jgi:hypothetical protein
LVRGGCISVSGGGDSGVGVSTASFLVGDSLVDTALLRIDQTEELSVTTSILLWVVSQGSATFLVGVDEIFSTASLVTG